MHFEIYSWDNKFILLPTISFNYGDTTGIQLDWLKWGLEIYTTH